MFPVGAVRRVFMDFNTTGNQWLRASGSSFTSFLLTRHSCNPELKICVLLRVYPLLESRASTAVTFYDNTKQCYFSGAGYCQIEVYVLREENVQTFQTENLFCCSHIVLHHNFALLQNTRIMCNHNHSDDHLFSYPFVLYTGVPIRSHNIHTKYVLVT